MKRSRAPNFTTAEIMHLLKLVEKYPILENKKTDGATTKDKQVAWQKLADEYNSQTNFSPRTAENLLSCYKNQKIKAKKSHSSEKMAIRAPILLEAIEEHGQDWDRVAEATEASTSECQYTFQQLVKEAKKEEVIHKKEINRTGGGPPPQSPCGSSDPIMEKVKTLIGPSLEGLYTIYDGDADFMKQQQASVSIDAQIEPIELKYIQESSQIENVCTPDHHLNKSGDQKRLNVMKRKVDPSLESLKKGKKKVNVCHSFQELADDKKELVRSQKLLIDSQMEHQQLLIELAKEKLVHEKRKNEMELEFLQKKYEMELDLLKK